MGTDAISPAPPGAQTGRRTRRAVRVLSSPCGLCNPQPIMSSGAWSRATKLKAGIWAGAFGAVVIVGTLTGAQLKQDKQKEQVRSPQKKEGSKRGDKAN